MTLPITAGSQVRHRFHPDGDVGTVIAVHDTSPTATVWWGDRSSCSALADLLLVKPDNQWQRRVA